MQCECGAKQNGEAGVGGTDQAGQSASLCMTS
jgi:hypothetical protein